MEYIIMLHPTDKTDILDANLSKLGMYTKRVENEVCGIVYLYESKKDAERALVLSFVPIKHYIRFTRSNFGTSFGYLNGPEFTTAENGAIYATMMEAKSK